MNVTDTKSEINRSVSWLYNYTDGTVPPQHPGHFSLKHVVLFLPLSESIPTWVKPGVEHELLDNVQF